MECSVAGTTTLDRKCSDSVYLIWFPNLFSALLVQIRDWTSKYIVCSVFPTGWWYRAEKQIGSQISTRLHTITNLMHSVLRPWTIWFFLHLCCNLVFVKILYPNAVETLQVYPRIVLACQYWSCAVSHGYLGTCHAQILERGSLSPLL